MLGRCYYDGRGVSLNYETAVHWYQKAAEQGYAEAQSRLGDYYKYGTGIAQDHAKAVYWYQKAVEQGHAAAQFNLGLCYEYGTGLVQDYAKAAYWYRKGADQGDISSLSALSRFYQQGKGVPQSSEVAAYWQQKAIDSGHRGLQLFLGEDIQQYNDSVKLDYKKKAEQGNAVAQYVLGRLYYEDGDYVNAVKYLTMASQSDTSGAASFLLSKCYRNGFGVPQDVAKADSLQKKALEKGWDEAKSLDDLLKGVFD